MRPWLSPVVAILSLATGVAAQGVAVPPCNSSWLAESGLAVLQSRYSTATGTTSPDGENPPTYLSALDSLLSAMANAVRAPGAPCRVS